MAPRRKQLDESSRALIKHNMPTKKLSLYVGRGGVNNISITSPSDRNASWGDLRMSMMKVSLSDRSSGSKNNNNMCHWPLPAAPSHITATDGYSSGIRCHSFGTKPSNLYTSSESTITESGDHVEATSAPDVRSQPSHNDSTKSIGDEIDELLGMLRSTDFIGTIVPEFHSQYMTALDDFSSKIIHRQSQKESFTGRSKKSQLLHPSSPYSSPNTTPPSSPMPSSSRLLLQSGRRLASSTTSHGSQQCETARVLAPFLPSTCRSSKRVSPTRSQLCKEVNRLRTVLSSQEINFDDRQNSLSKSFQSLGSLLS